MEWQKIESAPRDGQRIMCYFPWRGYIVIVSWRSNPYEANGEPNWTTDNKESATLNYEPPSHWIPLPPPPDEECKKVSA